MITLNIGLQRRGLPDLTVTQVLDIIAERHAIGRHAAHVSDTEPTLVVEVHIAAASEIDHLARRLDQEAIAGWDPRAKVGYMEGPNAAAWGKFNPDYFINLDGTRLSNP
jgi:hypothetical protein